MNWWPIGSSLKRSNHERIGIRNLELDRIAVKIKSVLTFRVILITGTRIFSKNTPERTERSGFYFGCNLLRNYHIQFMH